MKNYPVHIAPQYLRARMGKICVAIAGDTVNELMEQALGIVRELPFMEFRLDYLDNPLTALPRIKQFLHDRSEATVVATCRREAQGGKFKGSQAEEIEVLVKSAEAGCQLVDIELPTAAALKRGEMDRIRAAGAAIIISHHDFEGMVDLDAIFEKIRKLGPEFIKIVPTAKSLADNITLMRFLERTVDTASVIGMCMGEFGITSRVLGIRSGSIFTFGASVPGAETGPGQIAARTMRETYRLEQVDAATKVYGVAGNPIKHSLSPIMMNTAFRRETENRVYLSLLTTRLSDLLKLVHEIPLQGLSITMPHKEDIIKHLAKTDPLSAKIGACNTVVRAADGNLYGFNTDVGGITGPLEKRLNLRGSKILVLGARGAARAAVFGLKDKGAEVFILNRTAETATKLARQAGARVMRRDALTKTHFDVVINATPVGQTGYKAQTILAPEELNTRLVFDLVYNPLETPLIKLAKEKGIPYISGVEMFVQQGARQFEIWTGKPAPEEEMLRVVLHGLRQQSGADAPLTLPPPMRLPEPVVVVPAAEVPVVEAPVPAAPVRTIASKAAPAPKGKTIAATPAKAVQVPKGKVIATPPPKAALAPAQKAKAPAAPKTVQQKKVAKPIKPTPKKKPSKPTKKATKKSHR
jgi:3-dehydroquinate dehydratase/shikimate dehydrogenase